MEPVDGGLAWIGKMVLLGHLREYAEAAGAGTARSVGPESSPAAMPPGYRVLHVTVSSSLAHQFMVFRYCGGWNTGQHLPAMEAPPATVVLVDDQSMFLAGLEGLLETMHEGRVVGKAQDGRDALDLVAEHRPDLVLMDINMPHMDGIEASKRIRRASPRTRIAVLSIYGHREFVIELLGSGVDSYLLKTADKEELLTAIRSVVGGERYIAHELRAMVAEDAQLGYRERRGTYGPLTNREAEVMKLILQERTTQEIAAYFFLSVATVETHRRNIFHKLDCRNIAGLVKYAMERGWGRSDH